MFCWPSSPEHSNKDGRVCTKAAEMWVAGMEKGQPPAESTADSQGQSQQEA